MASVDKRVRDGKVSWLARWRAPDGSQRKRTFPRKVDAERFLTGVDSRILDGSYIDPARSRVRVAEWSEQWLAGQLQLKPSTRARYESLLRVHVLPTWGPVPLARIGHAEVAEWVSSLAASGMAASSVRHAHRVLSLVLDLAVRDGRLHRNPADGVPLPRAKSSEKRFLSHAQVAELARACGPHRLVVETLAYTGLRYGELAALRVSRLDLMRRRIDVVESVTEVGGVAIVGTPKTHQRRSVPVPRSLVDALAGEVAGKAPSDYVFSSPEGSMLRLQNFRRRCFDRAAAEVGLAGLTPHELRHTAASLAVSAGANVKAVQRMLGHASAAMTLDTYSGLFDDDLDAVAERLDVAAASARVPLVCPAPPVVDLDERRLGF